MTPNEELEEFLAPLPKWMRSVLDEDYGSLNQEERLEWISRQDEVCELRIEYQRILRQIPAKWNDYCKAARNTFDQTRAVEARYLLPKGLAGAPRKDGIADEALALLEDGKNFPQIATILSDKHGEKISSDSVRKLVERFRSRTESQK